MDRANLDLSLQLPRDMFHQLILDVCAALPRPLSDDPDALIRRDNAAMADIASFLPANGDEADIAGMIVITTAEARECLRAMRAHPTDSDPARDLRMQSERMMRQARGFRSLLLRVQAARRKREADPVERDKAAWNEHCIIGLMAEALGRDAPAAMAPPQPQPQPEAEAKPPPFEQLSEAEQYAVMYPRRAALIRRLGGLPQPCDFGPPEAALVRAIIATDTPIMRAVDRDEPGSG